MKKAHPKISYGYVVVAAAFCIMTLAWGANRSFGVFLEPMLREFGWTKAGLSGAFTLVMVLMGGTSILVGRLTDLFGPRIVGAICGLFLGLGYILISQVTEIWHLYLFFGGLTGIGMSIAFAPLMSVVARWFVKRRALMTGILVSGPALGITLMPLLFSILIPAYGWRNSNIILGSIVLVIVIPAALFLKRDPKQMGLLPYGAALGKPQTSGIQTEGLSLREAMETRQFWMVCVMSFCDLFLINVLVVHLVIYAIELTIPPTQAAGILSLAAGVSIPGRVVIGGVADRIGNKPALLICLILSVAAFALLLAACNYGCSIYLLPSMVSAYGLQGPLRRLCWRICLV